MDQGSGYSDIFSELTILLAAVAFISSAFRKIGLNPIIGLFAAGIVLGPHGFKFVDHSGSIELFSEFGLMFLLFIVGLELSVDRIKIMARAIFGHGFAHFILTTTAFSAIGYFLFPKWQIGVTLGLALAMSSTAFVLQMLAQRKQLTSNNGRQTFSVLLFQDLMVGPLLAVIPLIALSANKTNTVSDTKSLGIVIAVIAMILVFLLAKLLLENTLSTLRGDEENSFLAAIILVAIVMGWIAHKLGMSPTLGAFMAGLALSNAEWRHEVKDMIQPFQSTLLGFFFIGVGMLIPIQSDTATLLLMIATALGIMATKIFAGTLSGLVNGLGIKKSFQTSVFLSQAGEFSILLIGTLGGLKLLSIQDVSFWTGSAVITMALTPIATFWINKKEDDSGTKENPPDEKKVIEKTEIPNSH